MKSIFNISKGFLSVAILSAAFVSCSEDKMDSINNDNNHTTVVPSKFILADVLTSTAFNNVGGDFNTYFASYVEHEVGISNQLYRAETRTGEPSSSTTFNNVWENTYSVLKNARIIVHKCSEDGDQHGNYTTRGIGEVMVALNSGLIADAFGDTPYTQAALPELTNGHEPDTRHAGKYLPEHPAKSGQCHRRPTARRQSHIRRRRQLRFTVQRRYRYVA